MLGRPAEEIGAGELQRASLALGHLISLDCVAVGREWFRDGRWLTVHSSEGNALNTILSKPTAELTVDDALLCAAVEAPLAGAVGKGIDPMAEVGLTAMDWMDGATAVCPHGCLLYTSPSPRDRG